MLWLTIGIIISIGLTSLYFVLKNKGIAVRWWELAMVITGMVILLFAIQNVGASFFEWEGDGTAWKFLIFPGLIGVLLMGVAFGTTIRRMRNV